MSPEVIDIGAIWSAEAGSRGLCADGARGPSQGLSAVVDGWLWVREEVRSPTTRENEMSEELEQNLRDAQVALDAAQMGYRRELWRLALHEYERSWPAAELVVMIRASGFYDSVPVALYDAQGTLVADLAGDSAPFGAMEPNLDYERMILDAGWQVHDPLVQHAVDDTVARRAGDEEVAVARGALGTIYLADVRAFLAGQSPNEIALRRKELTGPESMRTRQPEAVVTAGVPVVAMAGCDEYGNHLSADQAPQTTTVEGADPFEVDGSSPDM